MSTEKIIWTVLPNGHVNINGTHYVKLTVGMAPRLYGAGTPTLSDYPDFVDWPKTLKSAKFDFVFHEGATTKTVTGMPDPGSPSKPDSTTWGYLFDGTTQVVPYAFQDWSQRYIETYPATDLYGFLKGQYQKIIATWPVIPPTFSQISRQLSQLAADGFPSPNEYQRLLLSLKDRGKKSFPPPLNTQDALVQMELFFHRGKGATGRSQSNPPDGWHFKGPYPTQGQSLDFHQQIAALIKFGELQRRLGIAIDFVVPLAGLLTGTGSVRLNMPLLGANDITPQTIYHLAPGVFSPASKTGSLHNGMVNLNNPEFTLMQIDVDGGAIKFVGLIRQLFSSLDAVLTTEARTHQPQTVTLPALRSGGLGLLQSGRASDLAAYLPQTVANNTTAEGGGGSGIQFYAEDVLQGYRIDVWDSFTKHWHCLHQRGPALDPNDDPSSTTPTYLPGSYQFLRALKPHDYWKPTLIDEGFVGMGMTSDPNGPTNGGPGPDVYLHELVWRWMGWSLAAQRPNLFMGLDDTPDSYNAADSAVGAGVQMLTRFGAEPGSLPKLRFGRGYRIRSRTADIAGNGPAASSPVTTFETPPASQPPTVYRRFEPVITPAVVLHDKIAATQAEIGSPGESVKRLVLRSNVSKTGHYVSPPAERAFLAGLGYSSIPARTIRWIVPPRMSQILAEHHGMFDKGAGWRPDALQLMTKYDNALGPENEADVVYGDPGSADPFPNPLPYLPDILSAGASFLGLPGTTIAYGPKGTLPGGQSLSFTGVWPDFKPFRLVMMGLPKGFPAKPPTWNAGQRILRVYVEQAAMVQNPISKTYDFPVANISSFLTPLGLNLMGIWGWLEEYEHAGKITAKELLGIAEFALAGLVWSLTPNQQITFIHATQQPLIKPRFFGLVTDRISLGSTTATLLAKPMPIDGDSTTKVDITAVWVDPRDDIAVDPCPQPNSGKIPGLPKQITNTAHVAEIPVSAGTTSIPFPLKNGYVHKFGDTKHHWVNYTATATSRFTEYFPNDPKVPTTWSNTVDKINVLSSARPKAPNILYAVPAFGWVNKSTAKLTTSLRKGGMLRVYLDRPFYSSGPDELLGVVLINSKAQADAWRGRARRAMAAHNLARNANSGVTTVLEKYVTQWGMDPLWVSPGIQTPPMTTDFPTGATQTNLYLEELGGRSGKVPVGVAGFPVVYDDTRCLYFCDIPFQWGNSYYPFVRMALASYQPWSMAFPDTMHLSRVVMTDFVQLTPDRLAEVRIHAKPTDPRYVELGVLGVTSGGNKPGTIMEVTLEQRAPQIGSSSDELAWIPVPNIDLALTPTKVPKSDFTVWRVNFDLPHAVGTVPFRLVVREYELYPHEWGVYVPPKSTTGRTRKDAVAPPQMDKRLVYAATLEI